MFVVSVFPAIAGNEAISDETRESIEYLLEFVKSSDVTFVRNGKEYNAEAAHEHMKKKFDHFKKEVSSPEDFVRLSATKSLISGKSYKVILKDGTSSTCAEWLLKELEAFRARKGNRDSKK